MKTAKFFRTTVMIMTIIFISGLSSLAGKPAIAPAIMIQNMIKESVAYPDLVVKKGLAGYVEVIFKLDEEGRIIVKQTVSDNAELENLVKEQLSSISFKEVKSIFNKHYRIKITFQLTE